VQTGEGGVVGYKKPNHLQHAVKLGNSECLTEKTRKKTSSPVKKQEQSQCTVVAEENTEATARAGWWKRPRGTGGQNRQRSGRMEPKTKLKGVQRTDRKAQAKIQRRRVNLRGEKKTQKLGLNTGRVETLAEKQGLLPSN